MKREREGRGREKEERERERGREGGREREREREEGRGRGREGGGGGSEAKLAQAKGTLLSLLVRRMCRIKEESATPTAAHTRATCACTACRISKVRCERSAPSEQCTRCLRLGLRCRLTGVVKRGGGRNSLRDITRLGTAVRTVHEEEQAVGSEDAPIGLNSIADDDHPVAAEPHAAAGNGVGVGVGCGGGGAGFGSVKRDWLPVQSLRTMSALIEKVDSLPGREALVKHWISIAARSRSCSLLGNVLTLAHSTALTFDKLTCLLHSIAQMSDTQCPTPAFITEWQEHDVPVIMRSQVGGRPPQRCSRWSNHPHGPL